MAGKQESLSDYYEEAKEIARIEKGLGIELWDRIAIERDGDKYYERIQLYSYDLPRSIAEKYEWVIRWRAAKLQCQYPRYCVRIYHSPYRKIAGDNIGMQSDLDKFIASKAQLSKQQRRLDEYIAHEKENNIFFDESADEMVVKVKAKIERNRQIVAEAEARLIEKVKQYKAKHHG